MLRNGDEIFPAMLDAIEAAEHTIDFLTFVYWEGEVGTEFAQALAERARAGVRVRVLLDAWGAHPIEQRPGRGDGEAGVQLRWFRPLRPVPARQVNHRTHRKVLIVDEAVGFTGGVGIADEWHGNARNESEWRDTHFRIRGPAVDGLRAAFLDNWVETDPSCSTRTWTASPNSPSPASAVVQSVRGASETGWSDIATLFRSLLQLARERVRITTAYFVPDTSSANGCAPRPTAASRCRSSCPGPHTDKRFVQLAGEVGVRRLLEAA